MKCHKKQKYQHIANNQGMTLVEVLVAMAVLMVALLTFLPLGQTTFQNIYTAGKKIKEGYASVSVIEKLLGNDGANGDYETRTGNVPLQFHAYKEDGNKDATVTPLKAGKDNKESKDGIQSIDGATLLSTPEQPGKGFSTFICDSVTSSMLAFPTHIADDFIKKHITLYAVGFHFANDEPVKLEYTDENGKRQTVTADDKYYTFTPDKKDASIAHLVLCGDNDQINFTHSPLYVTYDDYTIRLEIDAPTVIMVGEVASDGNYYYYVTSGEPIDENGMVNEETGEVQIVRKKMDNIGPISKEHVTLNAAMNNVVWVDKGEGDNYGGSNEYGSYIMCGDHGQIRRFWKNSTTGNYGWDGDRVIDYDYYNGAETKIEKMGTTVNYSYAVSDSNTNMELLPKPPDNNKPIFNRVCTHTLFTSNAINKHPDLKFYAAGNLLYAEAVRGAAKGGNCFITSPTKSGYNKNLMKENDIKDGTMLQQVSAKNITPYDEFHGLDTSIANRNDITLTSVVPINFKTKGQGSTHEQYPQKSYMLYCGSIPAVMDIWTKDGLIDYNSNGDRITPWRATLGVAFQDDKKTGAPFYKKIGKIWGNGASEHHGHVWNYGATTPKNYALSGVCGPENYDENRCKTLVNSLKSAQQSGVLNTYEKTVYPLHMGFHQQYMQTQNETEITVSYLSHPYALADKPIVRCARDQSPNRTDAYSGVFEWGSDKSVTIIDADTVNYPDDEGNDRYFSIAVGYYVGGLAYEDWSYGGSTLWDYHNVSVPTVMNNGIVFMRSGFNKDSEDKTFVANQMAQMTKENNIFRPFFTTNDYTVRTQSDGTSTLNLRKNTFDRNVSAGYWRDVYHPLFYSIHGTEYEPIGGNRFNYVMGHILQDKQLNCVCWGETWTGRPEAMWGASDGTMMSWYLDKDNNKTRGNNVDAEFQSYLNLKRANDLHKKYDEECGGDWQFEQKYCTALSPESKWFALPNSLTGHKGVIAAFRTDDSGWNSGDESCYSTKDKQNNPMFNNTYLDKCSLQLATKGGTKIEDESILEKRGFISPLRTIEDVEFANDTWVGVGDWGLSNPIKEDGITYCGKDAVLYNGKGAPRGSWVCVRTWLDQNNGVDRGPKDGNCNYIWQAVQVSKQEHCNIEQVSYANGMWYAMGYYDANGNGEYDYNAKEYAMLFYARDPQKPCNGEEKDGSWDGGWKLCKTKGSDHTQAYQNDGNGEFIPFEIDGINSVASRND